METKQRETMFNILEYPYPVMAINRELYYIWLFKAMSYGCVERSWHDKRAKKYWQPNKVGLCSIFTK